MVPKLISLQRWKDMFKICRELIKQETYLDVDHALVLGVATLLLIQKYCLHVEYSITNITIFPLLYYVYICINV